MTTNLVFFKEPLGNNIDSRVASLRVMNELQPTPQQLSEAQYEFGLHQNEVRNSLAGFMTREMLLTDGTRLRIVSNSGMHTLMLWPVGSSNVTFAEGSGFILHPSDSLPDADLTERAFGSTPLWLTAKYASGLTASYRKVATLDAPSIVDTKQVAGPVSWYGTVDTTDGEVHEAVLTWDHGLDSRYRLHQNQDCSGRPLTGGGVANSGKPGLYLWGVKIGTVYNVPATDPVLTVTLNVVGACIFHGFLCFISHIDLDYVVPDSTPDVAAAVAGANSKCATLFFLGPRGWEVGGKLTMSASIKGAWFFKPDGTEGASVYETTLANQKLLTVTLAEDTRSYFGVAEQYVTATFGQIDLDATTITVEPAGTPVTNTVTATPYFANGDWNWEDGGFGATEVLSSSYGWSGVGSGAVPLGALAANAGSFAATIGRGADADLISGVAASVAGLADTVGQFAAGGLYRFPRSNGGFSVLRGYREVNFFSVDNVVTSTYARSVTGRHYIAVDYLFDGTRKLIYEELQGTGLSYKFEVKSKESTQDTIAVPPTWPANPTNSNWPVASVFWTFGKTFTEYTYTISGSTKWVLKVGTDTVLTAEGGVQGGGAMVSVLTRTTKTPAVGTPGTAEEVVTTSAASGKLVTERAWLIDMDIRSGALIHERTVLEHTPTPVDTDLTARSFSGIQNDWQHKIHGAETLTAKLDVQYQFASANAQAWNVTLGTGFDFDPFGTMLQTISRTHDYIDQVEETSFVQSLSYNDGSPRVAPRYWGLTDEDPMPRKGHKAQIAVRTPSQAAISTGSYTTNKRTSYAMGVPDAVQHPMGYSTLGWWTSALWPLHTNLAAYLVDKYPAPPLSPALDSATLRAHPIYCL